VQLFPNPAFLQFLFVVVDKQTLERKIKQNLVMEALAVDLASKLRARFSRKLATLQTRNIKKAQNGTKILHQIILH